MGEHVKTCESRAVRRVIYKHVLKPETPEHQNALEPGGTPFRRLTLTTETTNR